MKCQVKKKIFHWPYVEGLRMDEAMHPLTILSTGLYGHDLLNQNGAPLRLVVPWKYGFKSIKSIVAIRFVDKQPDATWSMVAPSEYGFYSNVNNKFIILDGLKEQKEELVNFYVGLH